MWKLREIRPSQIENHFKDVFCGLLCAHTEREFVVLDCAPRVLSTAAINKVRAL